MNKEFINNLNGFIKEYNKFINQDKFLQKRDFYNLSKKYGNTLLEINNYKDYIPANIYTRINEIIDDKNFSWIDKHNELYISRKLKEEKNYFDTLFTKYNIPIILDEEQRRAIIADCEASLIIAGAGTGKTTTMAAKVKYLVDKQQIKPEKILVLSYTNKAVGELKRQIHDTFAIPADITTFHALGLRIIKDKYLNNYTHIDEAKKEKIIFEYVRDVLFRNKKLLQIVIDLYSDCFSNNFKKNFYKYNDFATYFDDYKKGRYEEAKKEGKVESYIKNKEENLLFRDKPKGLDFRRYRSRKEAYIANFLFKNNIEYDYEVPVCFKNNYAFPFHPDFCIAIDGKPLIIEYFGLCEYQEDGKFSKEEIERYKEIKLKKEKELNSRKMDYIFLDGKDTTQVLTLLKLELQKRGVILKERDTKELYFHILDDFMDVEFHEFIKEMGKTISKLKENCAKDETFTEIIEFYRVNSVNQTDFKNKQMNIYIIRDLFYYYQNRLKKLSKIGIDYADMINEAYEFLRKDPNNSKCPRYEYLLIDEYQDVSFSRFLLARQIVQNFKTKIIAVGDDWQTIYTFAGSNIKLFYNFKKQFPLMEEYKITKTYRNSQELIDTAGSFILKNEEQLKKQLISDKNTKNPIEIVYYQRVGLKMVDILAKTLDQIYMNNKEDVILLLARRNVTLKNIIKDDRFSESYNNRIIYKKYPDLKIEALTIHKAKGLTCDQAIVLDLRNKVFPSTRMEKNIVYHFYKVTRVWQEEFPYAEERRLFYVALTRTKNKVYLLSPIEKELQSIFVKEIKNYDNVIETEEKTIEIM